jgi:hypothetical protein
MKGSKSYYGNLCILSSKSLAIVFSGRFLASAHRRSGQNLRISLLIVHTANLDPDLYPRY